MGNKSSGLRRPKGQGCIYSISDTTHRLQIADGVLLNGKPRYRYKTFHGTRAQAERELPIFIAEVRGGQHRGRSCDKNRSVGQFLYEWMNEHIASGLKTNTIRSFKNKMECHLIPGFSHVRLVDLSLDDIIEFFQVKRGENGRKNDKGRLSERTIAHLHRHLKQALDIAEERDLIIRNPMRVRSYRPPNPSKADIETLRANEVDIFLNGFRNTAYFAAVHTALHNGLRRAEICALRWKDIDFEAGTYGELKVRETLNCAGAGKGWIYEPPKTKESKRTIDRTEENSNVLRQHKERQRLEYMMNNTPFYERNSLVFSWPDGRPILPQSLSQAVRRVATDNGFSHIALRSLRHSMATLFIQAGVPISVVSKRLGHTRVSTTQDIYVHVTKEMQIDSISQFERMLDKANKRQ